MQTSNPFSIVLSNYTLEECFPFLDADALDATRSRFIRVSMIEFTNECVPNYVYCSRFV